MKICNECDVEMIENIEIRGQHPFELGIDGKSNIELVLPGKSIFSKIAKVKSRVCPCCGKVELYVDKEKVKECINK